MNRQIFNQCIAENNFRDLFLELNWNRPKTKDLYEDIDDKEYHFRYIAEMRGFMVLTCEMEAIPATAMCKRIDNKLRPHSQEYILIITETGTKHHKWIIPVRNTEKRDIVTIEYNDVAKADFLYNKLGLLNIADNETVTIQDIKEKIQASFAVNSEKITKDFFREFKQEHDRFFNFITGIDDEIKEDGKGKKKNRKKDWYASVMLNRLMFCYFVQKKGFLDGDVNYLHNKLKAFISAKEDGSFYTTFYRGFLCALFHDGLNSPRHQEDFHKKYGCIPYLNGGMFDEHEIEREYKDIDIEDEAFENLFSFFDKWEWHLDTRLTASGKDINPDVLGYIFEQYINDRAAMGAYYTKEDITEYIGKNCILPFLMDKTAEKSPKAFKPNDYIWTLLKESGDKYIYDAVKKGYSADWQERIPDYIQQGIPLLPEQKNLLERRSRWNEKTDDEFALPTEIWRETIERLQRCDSLLAKISNGEITEINDFITYNLDIRLFVEDVIRNTQDHLLVLHFYEALQNVTILDPTCGSGAFLFAAMNILEPLYEACIDRMEDFNKQNGNLFKAQLEEIDAKYSSNRQYFIFKSIILRNLYGVDIMVEATEIAKLRLFLKMVAVVEVDRHKDNMGLDPLPDIDFNIKCGNTLVGYATEEELNNALSYGDMFALQEFKEKINTLMLQVSKAYELFRSEQLKVYDDNASIKATKDELKKRLVELNDLLNHHMHNSIARSYDYKEWLKSHQPFHWLAEFYLIIQGNGGFDVIIGNPPYVGYTRKNKETKKAVVDIYTVRGYSTLPTSNLYAFTIERSHNIMHSKAKIGMIIPISAFANDSMKELQSLFKSSFANIYISNFHQRPAQLFVGVLQRLSICIASKDIPKNIFTTGINRWYEDNRNLLFQNLSYVLADQSHQSHMIKIGTGIEASIFSKYVTNCVISSYLGGSNIQNSMFYRTAGGGYWVTFLNKEFDCVSVSNKHTAFDSDYSSKYFTAALNSNLFWWYYSINYDLFNFKDYMIFGFQITYDNHILKEIIKASDKMEENLRKNASYYVINSKTNGETNTVTYRKQLSKSIMDEIDIILADHYGFTEEELDFIINYDIKYRMGDELNEE
jgi:tRNA1(Val) A37 N6-methylase TrmN6